MQTSAQGVQVLTKVKGQKKAVSCRIEIDLKNNKGVFRDKEDVDWDKPHGTVVEFLIDGRVQLNGEAGLSTFLRSNVLVNPHLELHYKLLEEEEVHVERVSHKVPHIPDATAPHPHTMKLGEFLAHAKLFGKITVKEWLFTAFSRVSDAVLQDLIANHNISKKTFDRPLPDLSEDEFKKLFSGIQEASLLPPSTSSVLAIGEEGLAKSILRLGDIDYFSVVTRRPAICDFKPIQVEVAIARIIQRGSHQNEDDEDSVQVVRFANRVPLQFDKAGCAIFKAITTVNWKVYGLKQARGQTPVGPYIIAVSVVSPFIKFKNASKETIDASDELVEEIRRGLMMAGQRLSRHLRREHKEAMLESKMQHIEQFAPILVDGLVRITESNEARKSAAHTGLLKILGRDTQVAEKELEEADRRLERHLASKKKRLGAAYELIMAREQGGVAVAEDDEEFEDEDILEEVKPRKGKGSAQTKALEGEKDKKKSSKKTEDKAKAAKEKPKAAKEKPKAAKEKPKAAKEKPKAAKEKPKAAKEKPKAAKEKVKPTLPAAKATKPSSKTVAKATAKKAKPQKSSKK
jgi:DNA topoisomerase-6 subunit B